ncbi:VOC family protein [Cognatiyoonia sp. IB215182]|uniref:VOC family protein n=1 Tax=Cognatiyoonia sp. IB215182 TaxID=3097353 RepID=UPI002A151223|nr:VOC family protein [Cognatiyoonia sp. IB215182]MDX8351813.1 VOC family protein [Cognatiyoonia sp. IB215182]
MSILEMTTLGNSGWIGHSGPDQKEAKAFYQDVLGWKINDMPMQDGSSYSAAVIGETAIGGFSPMPEEKGAWTIYFTVADVDASTAKAKAKGATIIQPAMDMPGVGRMATLTDPHGARFALITYESMAS